MHTCVTQTCIKIQNFAIPLESSLMPLSSQLHTLCPRRGSGFSFFPTVNWFCLYLVFIQTEHAVRTWLHLASFPQYTMSLFTYSFMCLLFVLLPHHWTRSSWELQRGPVHWLAPSTLPRYVAQSRGSIRAGWMCSSGGQRLHSFQKNAFKKIKYKNDTQRGLPWWSNGWLHVSDAGYVGSIPGWGTKILHAAQCGQKKKKKKKHPTH